MDWGGDLGVIDGPDYVKRFSPFALLWMWGTMHRWLRTCLFMPLPDVLGDAERTIREWYRWYGFFVGWPKAFIAQDGQEGLPFPKGEWRCLFVGGTTEWKTSEAAYSVILRAQRLKKHIHIGRVNWWKRYKHFAQMRGSERWTGLEDGIADSGRVDDLMASESKRRSDWACEFCGLLYIISRG